MAKSNERSQSAATIVITTMIEWRSGAKKEVK
jgi:hypothetical protein